MAYKVSRPYDTLYKTFYDVFGKPFHGSNMGSFTLSDDYKWNVGKSTGSDQPFPGKPFKPIGWLPRPGFKRGLDQVFTNPNDAVKTITQRRKRGRARYGPVSGKWKVGGRNGRVRTVTVQKKNAKRYKKKSWKKRW